MGVGQLEKTVTKYRRRIVKSKQSVTDILKRIFGKKRHCKGVAWLFGGNIKLNNGCGQCFKQMVLNNVEVLLLRIVIKYLCLAGIPQST